MNEADDAPSDNKSAPPLPFTQNLVAALESIAGNQETGEEDSQLTTLSNPETENEDRQLTTLSI